MKWTIVLISLLIIGCAHEQPKPALKTVLVLGNKTTPAVCPEQEDLQKQLDDAHVEVAKWKEYANKLEKQLGVTLRDHN
jgi:hypothetical protein